MSLNASFSKQTFAQDLSVPQNNQDIERHKKPPTTHKETVVQLLAEEHLSTTISTSSTSKKFKSKQQLTGTRKLGFLLLGLAAVGGLLSGIELLPSSRKPSPIRPDTNPSTSSVKSLSEELQTTTSSESKMTPLIDKKLTIPLSDFPNITSSNTLRDLLEQCAAPLLPNRPLNSINVPIITPKNPPLPVSKRNEARTPAKSPTEKEKQHPKPESKPTASSLQLLAIALAVCNIAFIIIKKPQTCCNKPQSNQLQAKEGALLGDMRMSKQADLCEGTQSSEKAPHLKSSKSNSDNGKEEKNIDKGDGRIAQKSAPGASNEGRKELPSPTRHFLKTNLNDLSTCPAKVMLNLAELLSGPYRNKDPFVQVLNEQNLEFCPNDTASSEQKFEFRELTQLMNPAPTMNEVPSSSGVTKHLIYQLCQNLFMSMNLEEEPKFGTIPVERGTTQELLFNSEENAADQLDLLKALGTVFAHCLTNEYKTGKGFAPSLFQVITALSYGELEDLDPENPSQELRSRLQTECFSEVSQSRKKGDPIVAALVIAKQMHKLCGVAFLWDTWKAAGGKKLQQQIEGNYASGNRFDVAATWVTARPLPQITS